MIIVQEECISLIKHKDSQLIHFEGGSALHTLK